MTTPKEKYGNAVRSAKERGIEWQFTFDSWMEWWGADFELRGPRAHQLCMARNGDTGAYHPDNVRKATNSDNVREMRFRLGGNNRPVGTFKHTEQSREKMGLSRQGKPTWNSGLAGTGRCQAWNKGLDKAAQAAYKDMKKAEV